MRKKRSVIPMQLIRIMDDGFHMLIKIKINNLVARMIVDTGASRTVLDTKQSKRFFKEEKHSAYHDSKGIGTQSIQTFSIEVKKADIGKIKIIRATWLLFDISHANHNYIQMGLKPVDGILGSDILLEHNALIDYKKMQMILS